MSTIEDPDFNILKRQFLNFFEKEKFYSSEIERLLRQGKSRLVVNINDLRAFDLSLGKRLMADPIKLVPPLESALLEFAQTKARGKKRSALQRSFRAGFEGSFGEHLVAPRELNSALLTRLVCVEGIATKISLVRPKRVETVHFCEKTSKFSSMQYRDATSLDQAPTGSAVPTKDADGNILQLEFGYSTYIDHQKIFIQDMPERAEPGHMPRMIEVIAENDLVDNCKAGDRVHITGVYRALAWKASGETSGLYRTVLIANRVKVITQIGGSQMMTETDVKNIRKVSRRKDLFELFAKSIAPSLFGHEFVKKAIVLLLLGGEEKILPNKTHIRGDINMLLMGDPSVGKSQLLRAIMQVAKLSVSTTGKGSTGVGLTAAVLKDRESGERYLEAGATVLADRGVICIDEFDKMSEIDRAAIHEVMEQQTVTIAKAGIHTSLNARCSVVAAANPAYSSYDPNKTPQQNIPLPDSILSRFDVLFVILDKLDAEQDRKIADHVLRIHRYNKGGDERDIYDRPDEADEAEEETEIFQKFDRLLHDQPYVEDGPKKTKRKNEFLTIDFIRKFIEYAKARVHPALTKKAMRKICEAYCEIRNREEAVALPITARYVETIIRFATAHAKLRLSEAVEESDVKEILSILLYSLNNETVFPSGSEKADIETYVEADKENERSRESREAKSREADPKQTAKRKKGETGAEKKKRHREKQALRIWDGEVDEARKLAVVAAISKLSRRSNDVLGVDQLFEMLNTAEETAFSRKEFDHIVQLLEETNRIMIADGVIHRI